MSSSSKSVFFLDITVNVYLFFENAIKFASLPINIDVETTGTDIDAKPIGEIYWRTPLSGLKVRVTYGTFTIQMDMVINGTYNMSNEGTGGIYQGDVEYTYNDFRVSSEYRVIKTKSVFTGMPEVKRDLDTYYFMASYRFSEWFELGAYYSADYSNKDDRDGKDGLSEGLYVQKEQGYLKDFALCARYDINENWIIKLEGHLMNGLKGLDPLNYKDEPDWTLYAIKASYSF